MPMRNLVYTLGTLLILVGVSYIICIRYDYYLRDCVWVFASFYYLGMIILEWQARQDNE